MNLRFKTKGDAPVSGKQLIFLHALPGDASLRDSVIDMVLGSEGGHSYAVVYAEGESFPLDFDDYQLSRMNLYMPLITSRFLDECPADFDIDNLQTKRGIMVLPIVQSGDLIPRYSERFEAMHAITLSMENPAYEIEKQLTRMLISAELNDEIIKDAFTRKLFISYRKKDKAEIGKIMNAVRGTRWAASAAFWFDDFLVPGTDFEDGINDAMAESDAVVLAVTPSLTELNDLGEKNYVCAHEYPDAVEQGKTIIPVEAIPTDRKELDKEFDEFPPCVPIDDKAALDETFGQLGDAEPEADPYIKYLRGMAFLSGVRVERDPFKAVKLLDECVDLKVPEAALQLSYMYCFGISVADDLETAIRYKQKAFHIVQEWEPSEEKIAWLARILFNEGKDPDASIGMSNYDADTYMNAFLRYADELKASGKASDAFLKRLKLWEAEAHLHLGSVENRDEQEIRDLGLDYFSRELDRAGELINEVDGSDVEFYRVKAAYHSIRSSYYRERNDFEAASEHAEEASSCQQHIIWSDPSFEARWQMATYKGNCIGTDYLLFLKQLPMGPENYRLYVESFDRRVRDAINDFEALYTEKKHAGLAAEIVNAYENLKISAITRADKKKVKEDALRRCKQLREDYPNDVQLKNLELELGGTPDVGFVPGPSSHMNNDGMIGAGVAAKVLAVAAIVVHLIVCMYISVQSSLIVGGNVLSAIPQSIMIFGGTVMFDGRKSPIHIVADALVAAVLFRLASMLSPGVVPFGTEGISILYIIIAVASTIF